MAELSRQRCLAARSRLSERELRRRIADVPAAPALRLAATGFDLIAEFKPASPSRGVLIDGGEDRSGALERRVGAYARGGAAAVSVLTEPSAFGGSLRDLEAAASHGLPVMRKDFPVDAYQVAEARAHGASGVLVIVRLLDDGTLDRMLAASAELEMFVLLECFDEADLQRCERTALGPGALLGINARDLATLRCEPSRFTRLRGLGPGGLPRVAESGISAPADAAGVARAGYRLALVGTALMCCGDPERKLRALLAAGRTARQEVAPSP